MDLPNLTHLAQYEFHLTTTHHIRSKPYQISFALRDSVRDEIKKTIMLDTIEPFETPYSNSIVVVKISDCYKRIYIDFRKLNNMSVSDAKPMSEPQETFDMIGQSKYFTIVELCKWHWPIPMRDEDKDLT